MDNSPRKRREKDSKLKFKRQAPTVREGADIEFDEMNKPQAPKTIAPAYADDLFEGFEEEEEVINGELFNGHEEKTKDTSAILFDDINPSEQPIKAETVANINADEENPEGELFDGVKSMKTEVEGELFDGFDKQSEEAAEIQEKLKEEIIDQVAEQIAEAMPPAEVEEQTETIEEEIIPAAPEEPIIIEEQAPEQNEEAAPELSEEIVTEDAISEALDETISEAQEDSPAESTEDISDDEEESMNEADEEIIEPTINETEKVPDEIQVQAEVNTEETGIKEMTEMTEMTEITPIEEIPQNQPGNDPLEFDEFNTPVAEQPAQAQEEAMSNFAQAFNFEQSVPMLMQSLPTSTSLSPEAKKYVIYVDPENIDYIENLTIDERRLIINKILREQDELVFKQKKMQERKKFLSHAIVACMTIIIGFPIMFYAVNKAMEISIVNYKQSQQNFVELYKARSKHQGAVITPSE